MKVRRKIIRIDEEKCNGCGLCVPACAEGAIQIIDGKARLVSEVYCDGLGACIGECPQGAITIEEREAEAFDPEAVEKHLAREKSSLKEEPAEIIDSCESESATLPCGCPGTTSQVLRGDEEFSGEVEGRRATPSLLKNWPVQISLVPVNAPYLHNARLLITADCVPFAFSDFHGQFLSGRTVLMGCPKLDNADFYRQKLAQIFAQNDIEDVEVVYMEVPCCSGLVYLVHSALKEAGKRMPFKATKITIRGEVCEQEEVK